MIFLKKYTFFFILLLIITPSVKAQNNQIDSLSKLSFEVLEKLEGSDILPATFSMASEAFRRDPFSI
jgi:hypothetical protein